LASSSGRKKGRKKKVSEEKEFREMRELLAKLFAFGK
jgi:hypothetical protein